jgi:hypothetical protein
MEEIDGRHIRELGGRFIRVRQSVVLAVLLVAAALWLAAAVVEGHGLAVPDSGTVSVPHVTVGPAAGVPAP